MLRDTSYNIFLSLCSLLLLCIVNLVYQFSWSSTLCIIWKVLAESCYHRGGLVFVLDDSNFCMGYLSHTSVYSNLTQNEI